MREPWLNKLINLLSQLRFTASIKSDGERLKVAIIWHLINSFLKDLFFVELTHAGVFLGVKKCNFRYRFSCPRKILFIHGKKLKLFVKLILAGLSTIVHALSKNNIDLSIGRNLLIRATFKFG